jgi:hypothetical protein
MATDPVLPSLVSVPVPAVSQHSGPAVGGLLAGQRQAARDAGWAAMLPGSLTLLGAGEGHGTAVRVVRASTGGLKSPILHRDHPPNLSGWPRSRPSLWPRFQAASTIG